MDLIKHMDVISGRVFDLFVVLVRGVDLDLAFVNVLGCVFDVVCVCVCVCGVCVC